MRRAMPGRARAGVDAPAAHHGAHRAAAGGPGPPGGGGACAVRQLRRPLPPSRRPEAERVLTKRDHMLPDLRHGLIAKDVFSLHVRNIAWQSGRRCGVLACSAWRARSVCPQREAGSPAPTPGPAAQGPEQPSGGPQHRGAPHARARRRGPAAALRAAVVGAVHPDHGGHGDDRCAYLQHKPNPNPDQGGHGDDVWCAAPTPPRRIMRRLAAARRRGEADALRQRAGVGKERQLSGAALSLPCRPCKRRPRAGRAAPTSRLGGNIRTRAVTRHGRPPWARTTMSQSDCASRPAGAGVRLCWRTARAAGASTPRPARRPHHLLDAVPGVAAPGGHGAAGDGAGCDRAAGHARAAAAAAARARRPGPPALPAVRAEGGRPPCAPGQDFC